MNTKLVTNTAFGIGFAVALAACAAIGTMSGMERDANIYGSPADLMFPWVLALPILVAAGWIAWGVASNRRQNSPSRYQDS
ncbi:hypothetical protein [Enemella sp. A6]|uniref:hypothetical protein n=1 Tax=Enemella sp. A6 TaxID=3440152 RepID=UPI003EB91E27